MQGYEYCELWWSDGNSPRLTFFRPMGAETVTIQQDKIRGDVDEWDAMKGAITELALSGWELVSTSLNSEGLFFRRDLQ